MFFRRNPIHRLGEALVNEAWKTAGLNLRVLWIKEYEKGSGGLTLGMMLEAAFLALHCIDRWTFSSVWDRFQGDDKVALQARDWLLTRLATWVGEHYLDGPSHKSQASISVDPDLRNWKAAYNDTQAAYSQYKAIMAEGGSSAPQSVKDEPRRDVLGEYVDRLSSALGVSGVVERTALWLNGAQFIRSLGSHRYPREAIDEAVSRCGHITPRA